MNYLIYLSIGVMGLSMDGWMDEWLNDWTNAMIMCVSVLMDELNEIWGMSE